MSRSRSADSGAHEETSPVHFQASFSQVLAAKSSSERGVTLNFHLKSPVEASNARMSPGTFSIRVWWYPCAAEFPTTMVPFTTIGGEEFVMYPTVGVNPS